MFFWSYEKHHYNMALIIRPRPTMHGSESDEMTKPLSKLQVLVRTHDLAIAYRAYQLGISRFF